MKPLEELRSGPTLAHGQVRPVCVESGSGQRLILVVGMHRSGTSAVTGVLSKLGVELGDELLPAAADNPKGFFENARVVDAHETLLAALGRSWRDPRPLPEGWESSLAASTAREEFARAIEQLLSRAKTVAVKDPRSSLVLPLWLDAAQRTGADASVVITVRHPDEVAASLLRRDGLPRARAHLLWIRHLLDAERASRDYPRVFVSYQALLLDWRAEVGRIDAALGTTLLSGSRDVADELDHFLDASLRNHEAEHVVDGSSSFQQLVAELYAAALLCTSELGDAEPSVFEAIAEDVRQVAAGYFDAMEDKFSLELSQELEREFKQQHLDQHRIDMSLQLAALRELWRPAMVGRAPGACRLYYRHESTEFIEERSVSVDPIATDDGHRALFELPEGTEADFLRIDPDDAPGVFAVTSLLVRGVEVADLAERVTRLSELKLPVTTTRAVLRFAAVGSDPYFEMDARGLFDAPADGPTRIELRFRTETVASELGTQLQGIGQALDDRVHDIAARLASMDTALAGLHAALGGVAADLRAVHDVGQDALGRSLSDLAGSHAAQIESATTAIKQQIEAGHAVVGTSLADFAGAQQAEIERSRRANLDQWATQQQGLVAINETLAELRAVFDAGQSAVGTSLANLAGTQRTEIERVTQTNLDQFEAHGQVLADIIATVAELRTAFAAGQSAVGTSLAALAKAQAAALQAELAPIHEQQAALLHWAQQRSPGYWWRRILHREGKPRMSSKLPQGILDVVPLANVEPAPGGDAATWVAGHDPQFLLRTGSKLSGGWYLFEASLPTTDGCLQSPCLYPDYGYGTSELERVFLPEPDAAGRLHGVVRFKADVHQLRFDPSVVPAKFSVADVTLRRLGRGRALMAMLRGAITPTQGSSWSHAWAVLLEFLKAASGGGVRHGGERAYARYIEAKRPAADDYDLWVRRFDTLTDARLAEMRETAEQLPLKPVISIVVPVYQTPERWLRRCLDSVLAQVYPHWELCLADDASPAPHVRRVLEEYSRRDPRVRVVFRERNGHISEASNSALELASGEFIALLDHDDELRPHALLEMAKAINRNPDWQLIYSDEDKIDQRGRRFAPYFKPDWNHELLLAQNCICHLAVYAAGLVSQVGGFRVGLEGSQDWDLALRCVERLSPRQIGHVPRILYHWRAIAGSTAMGVDQKGYASHAGLRAVSEHLHRIGAEADIEINPHGHLTVRRRMPGRAPRVSLVIPTRDKVELLRMSVGSILEKTEYPDFEILVVDNQSTDPETLDYFRELEADPRVRVLEYDAPFNYSAINNHAVAHATGEVIGLVNNDIEVISHDWLQTLVAQAVRPEIGAVGAMLYYPDDTIQHAGVVLGIGGIAGHVYTGLPADTPGQCGRALLAQEMSAVTAACLIIRKSVYQEVGGLDDQLSVAFNDIDFCLRVGSHGYRNIWTPYARLYHHESASRGYEDTPEKLERFNREVAFMRDRWGDALLEDPAYNPNLTLNGGGFTLAFPPRVPKREQTV